MTTEPELILYHLAPSRSSVVLWMLEEIGRPFDLREVKRTETRTPDYLAVNPMGKVPTLVHNGVAITETAAICCYLADTFPEAGLAIPVGDRLRGPYLKWLFFGPGCFEPALIDRMYDRPPAPASTAGWGDLDTIVKVLADALTPGPFLLGRQFTAADVTIGSGVRWALRLKAIPERQEFVDYVARLEARPARQRVAETDQRLAGT